ncbi:BlaI/MecI/CopY family transcriptional regulator [Verrucomicrobium sp. BvORR106]|uniref:BlaI/MecI/CopY family transcriptional regulator n=1 Tax=Verrucomicrobium sp. BvORR106 TaxID=1403819 RepID=UPI00068E843B|nr:BlaI/MecI/CopY family transcriptional regulator [Verrucomicrobium sp. BvORR106]
MAELPPLSKREREIMDIVFARGSVTVTDLLAELSDPPTRSALRSLLTILEDKGHLKHGKQGREFTYRPTVARQEAGRSALSRAIHTFFSGSLGKALAAHLSDPGATYSEEELRSISEFIESKRKEHNRTTPPSATQNPSSTDSKS